MHLCGHDSAPKETQRRCKTKDIDTFWELASKKHPQGTASEDVLDAHQVHMIMFYIHLLQMDNERMVKKVYNECKSNHNQKNWVWEVKSILAKCGLHSWWHQSSCDGLSHGEAKHVVTCCLFHLERENWKSDIASKPKLRSYNKPKADYGETEG